MPIYTKKGDKGKTSLGSGIHVWKNSERVESYGTVDELNAMLGLISAELSLLKKPYSKYLLTIVHQVQDDLFCIGSYLSNPANSDLITSLHKNTLLFEKKIDEMTAQMSEISNFTIPGGAVVAAQFHVARTIARRAERSIVALLRKEKINDDVVQYVNRLSDLLFTMNRFANLKAKKKEIIWKRR